MLGETLGPREPRSGSPNYLESEVKSTELRARSVRGTNNGGPTVFVELTETTVPFTKRTTVALDMSCR